MRRARPRLEIRIWIDGWFSFLAFDLFGMASFSGGAREPGNGTIRCYTTEYYSIVPPWFCWTDDPASLGLGSYRTRRLQIPSVLEGWLIPCCFRHVDPRAQHVRRKYSMYSTRFGGSDSATSLIHHDDVSHPTLDDYIRNVPIAGCLANRGADRIAGYMLP